MAENHRIGAEVNQPKILGHPESFALDSQILAGVDHHIEWAISSSCSNDYRLLGASRQSFSGSCEEAFDGRGHRSRLPSVRHRSCAGQFYDSQWIASGSLHNVERVPGIGLTDDAQEVQHGASAQASQRHLLTRRIERSCPVVSYGPQESDPVSGEASCCKHEGFAG
jgi:hypothetical protein